MFPVPMFRPAQVPIGRLRQHEDNFSYRKTVGQSWRLNTSEASSDALYSEADDDFSEFAKTQCYTENRGGQAYDIHKQLF